METKTIKVSKKAWDKLSRYKLDLDLPSLSELIEKMLDIVSVAKLKPKRRLQG